MGTKRQKQRKIPTQTQPIHEWERRMRQGGYFTPCPREPSGPIAKTLALCTAIGIVALIFLSVYLVSPAANPEPLYSNIPAEWHAQTSQTVQK